MGEIVHAWRDDPGRVRAWLDYARRKGLGAGWLRKTLREDRGYPPAEPLMAGGDPHRYREGPFAVFFEDNEAPPDTEAVPDIGDVRTETNPPLPPDVQRWWAFALDQLAREMPKGAFDTWVRPARLWAFEDNGSGAQVTILAATSQARDWLADRLTRILEHKLSGIAGRPVAVQFVVEAV